MSDDARPVVGSETQWYASQGGISGIPRVMRETHAGLDAALRPAGIDLVPVHTRPPEDTAGRPGAAAFAGDPVLARPLAQVEDVDALLMLGLTMNTDFGRILRVRRERRLPTVSLVYDILALQRPDWFLPKAREHYQAYLQQLLHVSDHVVVTSAEVRDQLLGLGWRIPGEVHVMLLGSLFPQQPPSPAPPSPLGLMYVSTVAPRKGHALLLEAFDLLREQGVPVELTIVGRKGWLADDLAAAITGHPAFGTSLHWQASASDDDLVALARRSHVGVVPAEEEGYGLFLDESLSLGLACVARDIPVFRERAHYPNLRFFDGTADDLAAAILRARDTAPAPLPSGTIRSMTDFTTELADLVLSVVGQAGPRHGDAP